MSPILNKQQVDYKYISMLPDKYCGNCSMYNFPGQCTLVKGFIAITGHCIKWETKK